MIENSAVLLVGGVAVAGLACATAWWAGRQGRPRRPARPAAAAAGPDRAGSWLARRAAADPRRAHPLDAGMIHRYQVTGLPARPDRQVGIVCGDLRRVRCADVWVNSENTEMLMARIDEFTVSSIIRYEGAVRDAVGRVVDDRIAQELARKVAGRRPVPPGTAISTGPGELRRYGVRHIVHVAAVQGEPGAGFRQVRDVGRCVTNVLAALDALGAGPTAGTILFPLLGTGDGGGELEPTISSMLGAAVDYFTTTPASAVSTMYLLAYTDVELAACEAIFAASRRLRAIDAATADSLGGHPAATITVAGPQPSLPTGQAQPAEPAEPASVVPVPARKKLQMGFVIDVVGYGARPALAQESVQHRLLLLVGHVLRDCGAGFDTVDYQWTGDGVNVFLPSDIDPTTALSNLIRSITRHLARDNRHCDDRIRLRMAVGVGIVGQSAVGFAGSTVVGINRLVDSAPLREAIAEHGSADLVVLVSDHVHAYVIRPGYPGLPTAEFRPVQVAVKEFREPAWLWIAPADSAGPAGLR